MILRIKGALVSTVSGSFPHLHLDVPRNTRSPASFWFPPLMLVSWLLREDQREPNTPRASLAFP